MPGGTLDLVERGLTGLRVRRDALCLDPVPLPELSEYGFAIRFRGHWDVRLRIRPGLLRVEVPPSGLPPLELGVPDRCVPVRPGEVCDLRLPD
ncbi:glycosyl hydrolase family 65 protein [Streptomyces sp. NPDC023838]|uniref:glycosyl hydrolase family 65 protein n=1 Tax=Streptomyces sp. NPDC023838 TaxID=3154325 RepID=UPI0033FEEF55